MARLRFVVGIVVGIVLFGASHASAIMPTGNGPEVKENPFEGEGDDESGGDCNPDQAVCTHACTHQGSGVLGCGGMNPCGLHERADTFEKVGDWKVRTSFFKGGFVTDNNQANYYCCKSNIQHCEHQSWKRCI